MPKFGVINFSDLAGATNPTGILNPAFLMLKQAIDKGDDPENVKQALFNWILSKQHRVSFNAAQHVEKILELPPDEAYAELVNMIGAGLRPESLPPVAKATLKKVIASLAGDVMHREGRAVSQKIAHLRGIRKRFPQESISTALVDRLLA